MAAAVPSFLQSCNSNDNSGFRKTNQKQGQSSAAVTDSFPTIGFLPTADPTAVAADQSRWRHGGVPFLLALACITSPSSLLSGSVDDEGTSLACSTRRDGGDSGTQHDSDDWARSCLSLLPLLPSRLPTLWISRLSSVGVAGGWVKGFPI
ncbi:hypothetical protein AAHE18_12G020400 [Arachis hypogaea]